jgi:carbon storage regulator
MHVIPRKKGQRVVIGDVILTVIEVRGDEVRFGIELPEGAGVHRPAIHEAILGPRAGAGQLITN